MAEVKVWTVEADSAGKFAPDDKPLTGTLSPNKAVGFVSGPKTPTPPYFSKGAEEELLR